MNKLFPKRKKIRTFEMCICAHGKTSHYGGFFSYGECKECECPKYLIDIGTTGDYEECEAHEKEMTSTSSCGVKTYYKKIK